LNNWIPRTEITPSDRQPAYSLSTTDINAITPERTYEIASLSQRTDSPIANSKNFEVWMPGMQEWMEVASITNCTDFQAKRANLNLTRLEVA